VLFQGYLVSEPILRVSYQEVLETCLAAGFLVHAFERLRELRRAPSVGRTERVRR
jgi:hypothetical protein